MTADVIACTDHCHACPPWRCETCGEMNTTDDLCSCWVVIDGLPLADIKGYLALGGLSVGPEAS